jgi:hypothetical protein
MVIDVMAGYVLILYLHCNEGDVTAWIPFPNVLPVINTELGCMQAYYFACHSTRIERAQQCAVCQWRSNCARVSLYLEKNY